MPTPSIIDHAFDDLAHSLRVLLEAHYRAHAGGLLMVDRAEAVGNIENALSSSLNAFHSLYDAIAKEMDKRPIDWNQNGPLATILALRNARHHNKANKIRTLHNYHAREAARPEQMVSYVLIDFPSPEDGADTFDVHLSWSDLDELLSLPKNESRLTPETCELIRNYLGTKKFAGYARQYDLNEKNVFFNVIPLLVNAAATITPLLKPTLQTVSMEGEIYAELFDGMLHADTANPEIDCGPIALLN